MKIMGSGEEYPPGSSLLDYVGINLPVKLVIGVDLSRASQICII
jgi:hypothetical protein